MARPRTLSQHSAQNSVVLWVLARRAQTGLVCLVLLSASRPSHCCTLPLSPCAACVRLVSPPPARLGNGTEWHRTEQERRHETLLARPDAISPYGGATARADAVLDGSATRCKPSVVWACGAGRRPAVLVAAKSAQVNGQGVGRGAKAVCATQLQSLQAAVGMPSALPVRLCLGAGRRDGASRRFMSSVWAMI